MPRPAVTSDAAGSPLPETVAAVRARTAANRAKVPVWRTGKPDAFLAAAVDVAREAVHSIANPSDVGTHLAVRTEGDRVVTHLFECRLPGYPGWQWFVVLTRNSRSKVVTVNEVGLLPSDDAVLAPEWVPWAERVRPEDAQPDDANQESPEDPMSEPNEPVAEPMVGALAEPPAGAAAAVERDVLESIMHTELAGDSAEAVDAEAGDAEALHTDADDAGEPDGTTAAGETH